jgi:hypothetical protein
MATSAYTYPGTRACVKSAGLKAVVGKFATVSDPPEPADQRKFFYPPDIVHVTNSVLSTSGRYDMVTLVTGDPTHPLETTVQNRLYAMRDLLVAPLADGAIPPWTPPDDYTVIQGKTIALADWTDYQQ